MKWLQKILVFFLLFFLVSCVAATPKLDMKGLDENYAHMSMKLLQSTHMVTSVAASPDGRYALSGSLDGTVRLWAIRSGRMVRKWDVDLSFAKGTVHNNAIVAFSSDGRYALTGGKGFKIWDLSTGKEIRTVGNKDVDSIDVSSDGRYVALGINLTSPTGGFIVLDDGFMSILDLETLKIREFNTGGARGRNVAVFSPNGRYALSNGRERPSLFSPWESGIFLWDLLTGNRIKKDTGAGMINSIAFSPDGQYAASATVWDSSISIWHMPSLRCLKRFKGHTGYMGIGSIVFSPDGRYIVSGGVSDGFIKVWDVFTGLEVQSFKGHSGGVYGVWSLSFPRHGKYLLSGGDASTKIWDISTGEEIATMIGFDDGEWLVITPEGYYNASENAARYLNVIVGDKSYGVDKFYDVFYRPDIVTAKLNGENIKDLISIKMSDAIKSPPPLVEIDSASKETNQPKVKVCYHIKDTGGGIGEVRLFHNGKLIQSDGYYREVAKTSTKKPQLASLDSKAIYEDMRSVSIKGTSASTPLTSKSKGDVFNECKEIDAVPGDNEVSIAAFNSSNTVQSYMKTANFNSKMKSENSHLYILAVGIDQYKDINVNLKYAVKDAKDLEEKLKVQSATLYKPENIHYLLLTDREATKTNIVNKVNELSNTIKPQDSFILFVAGHGVLLQNQYYMLTHDFNGEVSDTNMISSNEIVEMSKKIKSLNQLFIFDTCHAGGVDTIVSGLYDARMSVLAKKMGLHIYASASDKQSAMDGYKGNGLFTYTLLDGLNNNRAADRNKDGKVTVVGLGEYSKKMTTEISKEVGHSQTPLIINFGKDSPIYQLR